MYSDKQLHEMTSEERERAFTDRAVQFACWKGYERVPGTELYAPGSCRKK